MQRRRGAGRGGSYGFSKVFKVAAIRVRGGESYGNSFPLGGELGVTNISTNNVETTATVSMAKLTVSTPTFVSRDRTFSMGV